jgi:hypothetical protein
MDEEPLPSATAAFLRSPHHVALAVATLGIGLASATLLGVIAGVALYTVGWIHLPGSALFRAWRRRKQSDAQRARDHAAMQAFLARRASLFDSLTEHGRRRYTELASVCRDIEAASREGLAPDAPDTDPRLRKLDELMWTFLKLLGIEESLHRFLETERRDDLPGHVRDAELNATTLAKEVESLKSKPGPELEKRQRLWQSHAERLEVLRKRVERVEQGESNLALVSAEQERLVQQVKLIRADAVATRNADALTARIDATVEHLDETNKWLSQMDEFKDLVGDMPQTERRISFEAGVPSIARPGGRVQPEPPVLAPMDDARSAPPQARGRRRETER